MQKIILFPSLSFLTPFSFWCTLSLYLYLYSIELGLLYCLLCMFVCLYMCMEVCINSCLLVCLSSYAYFLLNLEIFSTGGGGRTGNTWHPKWGSCPLHHCDLTQAFPKIVNLNWPAICWLLQAYSIIYQIDTILTCEFFPSPRQIMLK